MHIKFYLILTTLCTSTYLQTSQVAHKWCEAPIKPATGLELQMMYDAKNGDLTQETLQSYLKQGADINAQTDLRNTALMQAAESGKKRSVQLLIEAGADLNMQNHHDWTALRFAAGSYEVSKLLIDAKAHLNLQDERDETVLFVLAHNGWPDIQLLIDAKADLNVPTRGGATALIRAVTMGHNYTIQLLLTAGADIDAKTKDGYTALMLAAIQGHSDIVQQLISAGADQTIINEKDTNRTAWHYAQDKDAFNKAVAAGFEEYRARQLLAKEIIAEQTTHIPEMQNIIMGYAYGESPTDLPFTTQKEKKPDPDDDWRMIWTDPD